MRNEKWILKFRGMSKDYVGMNFCQYSQNFSLEHDIAGDALDSSFPTFTNKENLMVVKYGQQ